MNLTDLRALYDREQRLDIVWSDAERTELPHLVRHVTLDAERGFVLYSNLNEENADQAISTQLDYFCARNIPFEWKAFSHDQPADLRDRLAHYGIVTDEEEAVMVLDLAANPDLLNAAPRGDVRRIEDLQDLTLLVAIEEAIWGRSFASLSERLRANMLSAPEALSVYLAYADGIPAAAAWTYFHAGTHFASIWGGSTLPQYQGQGLYTALLSIRAQEAAARGFRFLTVDAGPMSEPILTRQGFETIAYAYPCEWRPMS
jgi:GNAT superfamily N-acetyltransferase